MVAQLMKELGLLSDKKITLFHLGRKNMGQIVHGIIRRFIYEVNMSGASTRNEFFSGIMTRFTDLMINPAYVDEKSVAYDKNIITFRDITARLYGEMIQAGITNDGISFRIFDTWSGGRISVYAAAILLFFGKYEKAGMGYQLKQKIQQRNIEIFTMMHKEETQRVYSTVFNAEVLQEAGINIDTLRRWYSRESLTAPFSRNGDSFINFINKLSAGIYELDYPLGEINLGHPVEWNPGTRHMDIASAVKQLGAFLREILVINGVMDYAQNRGKE